MLRIRFSQLGGASLVEEWVSWGVGEHDRRQVYGKTATERAKKRLRVQHCENDDLTHYGELRLDNSQLKAFISTAQSPGRTMFTLGHELGHAAIHRINPGLDQRAAGTERLCDLFATELTMPAALVEDIWYRMPDARAIVTLAKITQSSLTASCIRIAELRGGITTGLASSDGFIFKCYGSISAHDLRYLVAQAYMTACEKEAAWIISDGIAAHVSAITKSPADASLIALAARRTRLRMYLLLVLRRQPVKTLMACGSADVSVATCHRGSRRRRIQGGDCGRIWRRGGPRGGSGCCSPAGR
jgi:hypothetical protein